MDAHELEQFRLRLIDKKKILLQAVKKTMDENRQSDSRMSFELVHDNPDRSVDELLKHVSAHVLGSKADELEVIESALLKIRTGTYGECEVCGIQIPPARLQVYPEAVCCLDCQNMREYTDRSALEHITRPRPPGLAEYLDDDE
jgi:DnaK suppressor protein